MAPVDERTPDRSPDAVAQRCHDLVSTLTAIQGRAQLLARMVRRASALTPEERDRMLDGVAAIEAAVSTGVTHLDALARDGRDRRVGDTATARRTAEPRAGGAGR
jgi:hypothetical protein